MYSGGVSVSGTVRSSGRVIVSSGGAASATTVSSGGSAIISPGAEERGAIVLSGGIEVVSAGGVASGTVVSSGGTEFVHLSGVASGITLNVGAKLTEVGLVVDGGQTLALAPITTSVSNFTVPATGTFLNVVSAISATAGWRRYRG